jgi:type IV fimbrial biogenesis protein FimT
LDHRQPIRLLDNKARQLLMRRTRHNGFTLLEMIVTMGVFALIIALGVPTLSKWVNNTRVRAVADGLQNGIRLAQTESLRRSRLVVFALTNNSTAPFTATASGKSWYVETVPSMLDGTETPQLVDSGALSTAASLTVSGPAAICFNSAGRLYASASAGVTGITGGATCTAATAPAYNVLLTPGSDRPLRVNVSLGGQVHMCDPAKTLSASNPDGCP